MTSIFDNQSIAFTDISGNTASIIPDVGLVITTPLKTLTTNVNGFTNGTDTLLFTDLFATVEKTKAIKYATSTLTKLSVEKTIEVKDPTAIGAYTNITSSIIDLADTVGRTTEVNSVGLTSTDGNISNNISASTISVNNNITSAFSQLTLNGVDIYDGTNTGSLTATNWTGNIQTQNTSANLTHYLNFSDSSSTGYGRPQKNASLSCNPSTGLLTSSQLTLNAPSVIDTNLGKYGIYINSSGTKTYPSFFSTFVYPSYYSSVQVGTNQTISAGNGTIVGMYNQLIKNDGTTNPVNQLSLKGFQNDITWSDNGNAPLWTTGMSNTITASCARSGCNYSGYVGEINIRPTTSTQNIAFTFEGMRTNMNIGDVNNTTGLSLSFPNSLNCNLNFMRFQNTSASNKVISIGTLNGYATSHFFNDTCIGNNSTNSTTMTNYYGFNNTVSFGNGNPTGSSATNTLTITNAYSFASNITLSSNGSTASNTTSITNLYGLFLNSPSVPARTTITNNWGIYSGWSLAKNYFAGVVSIGTTTPNSSAILQTDSTTQGFLPPRMTGAQANAIATPAEGLMVYITDTITSPFLIKGWWGYNGATWTQIG